MYDVDMENIAYEEAFDVDSHYGAEDLSLNSRKIIAGIAFTAAAGLLYTCINNAISYSALKEEFDAHPIGREVNNWNATENTINSAKYALEDTESMSCFSLPDGGATCTTTGHPPLPEKALEHINNARESLELTNNDAVARFNENLTTVETYIRLDDYNSAMESLANISEEASEIEFQYLSQVMDLHNNMNYYGEVAAYTGFGTFLSALFGVNAIITYDESEE